MTDHLPADLYLIGELEKGLAEMTARAVERDREIARLQKKLAEEKRSCLEEIGNRDHLEDVIQETHIALGGNGEWVGRLPMPPPPDSGDLCLDVPALAAQVVAERDAARADAAAMREAIAVQKDAFNEYNNEAGVTCQRLSEAREGVFRMLATQNPGAPLLAEIERLTAESILLKGAMNAQDERERNAGALCGIPWEEHGCDWPDAVAERVVWLRRKVEENNNAPNS